MVRDMVEAAVLNEVNGSHEVRDITLARARSDAMSGSRSRPPGICHSDLSLANGTLAQTFPVVLGHEGSGTVAEVGSDVTRVARRRPRRPQLGAAVPRLLVLHAQRAVAVRVLLAGCTRAARDR